MPQYNALMSRIMQQSQQPYTPYGGELVAGTNPTEQTAYGQLQSAYGSAQPYINQAAQYAALGASPIQASAIQNYSNPYQDMVTSATMNQLQNVQQANNTQAMGSTLGSGGLFNDRAGVMQGQLANQESLANAQTLGGLNTANYNQALAAAQGDRSAAAQAAYTFGNLGQENLSSILQGAGATLQSGQLQQQQQQALDTANYGQWQQQQAFPYQQLSWATGLGTGLGSQMGGSSQTTSTPAQPNPWSQALGLGMFGLGEFSDKRLKENAHKIGETKDGQPIYRYRYKGSPEWHIGLMAQEVEKDHPEAVGEALGFKTVDLKKATDKAAGFASGGAPFGGDGGMFGGDVASTPFASASGYVPKGGSMPTQPWSIKTPSSSGSGQQQDPMKALTGQLTADKKAGEGLSSLGDKFNNSSMGDAFNDTMQDAMDDFGENRGGRIPHRLGGGIVMPRGFAGGGFPMLDDDEDMQGGFDPDRDAFSPNAGMDAPPAFLPATRFGPKDDDQGLGPGTYSLGDMPPGFNPTRSDANRIYDEPENVLPRPRPHPGEDLETPAPDLPPAREVPGGPTAVADASAGPTGSLGSGRGLGDVRAPEAHDEHSNALRNALMTAGLGMMASRSPWLGSAIGEGGLAGLSAYSGTQRTEHKDALDEKKYDTQLKKLDEAASRADRELNLRTQQAADLKDYRERQLSQGKMPAGYRAGPNDGMEPIPGGPHDPDTFEKTEAAKAKAKVNAQIEAAAGNAAETGDVARLGELYRAVGPEAFRNLGRTSDPLKSAAIKWALQKDNEEKISPDQRSRLWQENHARGTGMGAAERAIAQSETRMGIAAMEAKNAITLGRGSIDKVPRTSFLPLNKLIEGAQKQTLSPEQAELNARVQAIVNSYSAVMSRGANVTTDASRHHAGELLQNAMNPEVFNRVLDTMEQEIDMALKSPQMMREFYAKKYGEGAVAGTASPQIGGAPGAAPAGGAPAAPAQGAPQAPPQAPPRPAGVAPGSQYSPSRQQWRTPDGHIYDAKGAAVQ